jgi:hypothetical protein
MSIWKMKGKKGKYLISDQAPGGIDEDGSITRERAMNLYRGTTGGFRDPALSEADKKIAADLTYIGPINATLMRSAAGIDLEDFKGGYSTKQIKQKLEKIKEITENKIKELTDTIANL